MTPEEYEILFGSSGDDSAPPPQPPPPPMSTTEAAPPQQPAPFQPPHRPPPRTQTQQSLAFISEPFDRFMDNASPLKRMAALGVIFFALFGGWVAISSLGDEGGVETEVQGETQTTTAPATTTPGAKPFRGEEWREEISEIMASGGSPHDQIGEISLLASDYGMNDWDVLVQMDYLVEQVTSGSIERNADDRAYQFEIAFIARSVDRATDDTTQESGFAFNLFQVSRDLGRGTEELSSDFIQINLSNLHEAIEENDWG